jgi:RNAse (barnase) inhibitor barstar
MSIARYEARLRDIVQAGVYHEPHGDVDAIASGADGNGYATFRVDLQGVQDKDGLLDAIARAMDFPDWFGHNWDALADCLGDLSWRPADGYVVLLQNCDGVHGRAESDFVTLMQVFSRAADDWREQGVPFWCFVDMQADGIAWLPLI